MHFIRSLVPTLALLALGCGGGGNDGSATGPTGSNTGPANTVQVGNDLFSPDSLVVPMATTVTWQWNSCTGSSDPYGSGQTCVTHSVTFDDGSGGSERQSSGSYSRTFGAAGTYAYHCAIHGAAMTGKVIVR